MKTTTWGKACTLDYGKALRDYLPERTEESCYQVFGTNGPIGWTAKPLCKTAGIVVGRKGAYRGVHFSPAPFFVIDTAFFVNLVDPDVDLKWAYYKLLTVDINRMDVGAAIPTTSRQDFYALPLTLPPPTVQRRIASILSAYDDLMENNRQRMALLEQAARELYREWFVRLRFPGHQRTKITNSLPQGWEKRTISGFIEADQVHLQTGPFGTQLKASDYTEEGIPVINVRNIGYGELRADKLEFVPDETAERLANHILRAGDIVFGRKGAVDRHLFVTTAQQGWMQGSDCIRLRALSDAVCPVLLTFAFRQPSHHDWMLRQCGNKATMASLNQEVISRIPLLVPPKPILTEFRSFAVDCLAQIANLTTQNHHLRHARDLLLPRLMSGEIEV